MRPRLLQHKRETTTAGRVRDALSSARDIAWNRERSARNNTGSGQTFRRRERRPCLAHGVQGVRCRCTFCLSIGRRENGGLCCRYVTVAPNAQMKAGTRVVEARQILWRIGAAGAELHSHMQPHRTAISIANGKDERANLDLPCSHLTVQLPPIAMACARLTIAIRQYSLLRLGLTLVSAVRSAWSKTAPQAPLSSERRCRRQLATSVGSGM